MKRDTDLPAIPERPENAHKGTFGRAVIIAGSRTMTGAACLATDAALKSGAGLATLAVPDCILPIVSVKLTCATFSPHEETPEGAFALSALDSLLDTIKLANSVAIGPGITQHLETSELVRQLIPNIDAPTVLDADGLNAFSGQVGKLKSKAPLILTPHPGEMSRLVDCSSKDVQREREKVAVEFARAGNCILVLKGAETIVTDGDRVFVNTTGNPGMATGGSGDVLTGVLAGLLAQGIDAYDAAKIGVNVHGLAGDIGAGELGEISLTAADILARLPAAFNRHQAS